MKFSIQAAKRRLRMNPPLARMVRMLKPHAARMAMAVVMLIVLAFVNMAVPAFLGVLFNEVFPNRRWGLLLLLLLGLLGVYVVRNVLYWSTKYTAVYIGELISFELRKRLFERLQQQNLRFYKNRNPGELSSRVMDDSFALQSFIQDELPKLLQNACLFVALVAVVYAVNWELALASTIILPVHLAVFHYFKGPIKQSSRNAQRYLAMAHGTLIEKFLAMEVVKGFTAEERENRAFVKAIDHSRASQLASKKFHVLQKIVADLLVGMGTIALLGFGGYQVMKDSPDAMQPGTFIAFFGYVGMLYPTVIVLMSGSAKLTKVSASVERINEMLKAQHPQTVGPAAPITQPIRGHIVFEDVEYDLEPDEESEQEQPILRHVSLEVPRGSVCMIMGPSGSGKTTLLSMVPRFIEPTEGRIRIDDVDIRRMRVRPLRESVGIAFQEAFLFNATALENLRYANPDATMWQIINIGRRTGAHELINRLPHGYHTMLGENGVNLSRGEKQKLVLTRALLKNPKILILDEATASIDAASEARIIPAILEFMKGRTVLIATHHNDLLGYADMLVRLEGGRVTYTGSPGETARAQPFRVHQPLGAGLRTMLALGVGLLALACGAPAAAQPVDPAELPDGADNALAADFQSGVDDRGVDAAVKTYLQRMRGNNANGPDRPVRRRRQQTGRAAAGRDEPGGFRPQQGLNDTGIQEVYEVLITRIRAGLGYSPVDEEAADQLPAPPAELDASTLLARDAEPGRRLLQIGYKTFETQPPHTWLAGRTILNNATAPNPDLREAARLLRSIRLDSDQVERLATRRVSLSYVEAEQCMQMLQTFGYTVVDGGGEVDKENLPAVMSIPESQNTMLVTGAAGGGSGGTSPTLTPGNPQEISEQTSAAPVTQLMVFYHPGQPEQLSRVLEDIRNRIDVPARQLLIEAMVLEISERGLDKLGVEWQLESSQGNLESLKLGRLPEFTDRENEEATAEVGLENVFGEFSATVEALIQENEAEVLSRPSVLTLDGRQAAIRVGEDIPIAKSVTGVGGGDQISLSFNYIPTGILLNVRPRISAEGEDVSLQLDGVVAAEVPGEELIVRDNQGDVLGRAPQISTRRVQTHTRIANNTPFIVGGLVSRDNVEQIDKVPFLGDIPIIKHAFRSRQVDNLKREVIIVITPFVLPENRVVGRNLPKDEDAFDSFGNELFRDAYRIRAEDVFDLGFIQENRYLQRMLRLARRAIERDVSLERRYPFSRFANRRIPGEHILVYRQMYEVINRLGIDEEINAERVIFFRPDDEAEAGFDVTFLDEYLLEAARLTPGDVKDLDREDRFARILEGLSSRDKALAMIYTRRRQDDVRAAMSQPVPELRVVDCADGDEWGQKLWKLNQPGEDGRQRHTILLREPDDLTRLKRAIVLKRAVQLNGSSDSLRLENFSLGRQLLMPSIKPDKVYLIDSDTARYFFLTEHYYPAFAEVVSSHLDALRESLHENGVNRLPQPKDQPLPQAPASLPETTQPQEAE